MTGSAQEANQSVNTSVHTHKDVDRTVTIRVDSRLLHRAKRSRINLSEAARAGIEAAIRSADFHASSKWLAKHSVASDEPVETTIRRIREGE